LEHVAEGVDVVGDRWRTAFEGRCGKPAVSKPLKSVAQLKGEAGEVSRRCPDQGRAQRGRSPFID
jgi:hypothetical protein